MASRADARWKNSARRLANCRANPSGMFARLNFFACRAGNIVEGTKMHEEVRMKARISLNRLQDRFWSNKLPRSFGVPSIATRVLVATWRLRDEPMTAIPPLRHSKQD